VLNGQLDTKGLLRVEIENRFGLTDIAIPQVAHQDYFGRDVVMDEILDKKNNGGSSADLKILDGNPFERVWIANKHFFFFSSN